MPITKASAPLLLSLLVAACASPGSSPAASFDARSNPRYAGVASGTDCDPGWTLATPRDPMFFYFRDVGIAKTETEALDGAWERTALAYARQVSAIVSENVEYATRHGSKAGVDTTITRAFMSRAMASGLEQVAQSKACPVPDGYRVWKLFRVSTALTLRRLMDVDPLARGIDFTNELRAGAPRR